MNVGVGECSYLLAETLFLSPGGSVLVFWRKRFSSMTASPVKTDSLCLLFPKGNRAVFNWFNQRGALPHVFVSEIT